MKKKAILFYVLILITIFLIYYNFNQNPEIEHYIDVIEKDKVFT